MIKRTFSILCALMLALSLCSCGSNTDAPSESSSASNPKEESTYPVWEIASDETTFSDLLSEHLFEYSDCMTSFAEHTEEFCTDVQNGQLLTDNVAYSILREKLLSWCHGVDSYPQESVFESSDGLFNCYQELSTLTHEFINSMDSVSDIDDMESYINSFVASASEKLDEISQIAQPLYLVGKWLVDNQYIWEYKEDGTVIYPDGTTQHWRLKETDEVEDKSIWKLEYQNAENSQIYYEVVNGKDLAKLTVTPMADGTVEVIKEVAYSGTYTVFSYSLITNSGIDNATTTLPESNNQKQSSSEYWCMGKNDTCQNKTDSPDDFFCNKCDPNGDNIEG